MIIAVLNIGFHAWQPARLPWSVAPLLVYTIGMAELNFQVRAVGLDRLTQLGAQFKQLRFEITGGRGPSETAGSIFSGLVIRRGWKVRAPAPGAVAPQMD